MSILCPKHYFFFQIKIWKLGVLVPWLVWSRSHVSCVMDKKKKNKKTLTLNYTHWLYFSAPWGFSVGSVGKEFACHAGDSGDGFSSWVGKIPLKKRMATHSSILAWRIPQTEEPVGSSPQGHKELDTTEETEHAQARVRTHRFCSVPAVMGFPSGSDGKESACNADWFSPWVQSLGWEKPWRRAWQSTLVFLPGESYGQRSQVGYSPWGNEESDTTEWLSTAQHVVC